MTAAERLELRQAVDQAVRARNSRAGQPYKRREEPVTWRRGRIPGRCNLCGYPAKNGLCAAHSWAAGEA